MKLLATAALCCALAIPAQADEEEDMREIAVNIVAFAAVARHDCPRIDANDVSVLGAVRMFGVEMAEIKRSDKLMARGQEVVEKMRSNLEYSCQRIWEDYGDEGKVIPGIVERD